MSVTLVSMFFDLKQQRSKSFYINHGNAILSLDAPLVLFCDGETRPELEKLRETRTTVYIEKPIAEYEYYRTLLPIVQKNRETRPSPDVRNTSEYFLLSVFKMYALYIAYQRQDFPSTHYMWIDIGCSHVLRDIPNAVLPILANPRPKIGCCYIHYRSSTELYPMENYFTGNGKTGIAAGLLTVEAPYISKLFTLFQSILYDQITRGVGHAEEQVLVYCYDQHPEWFSIYTGDYYSLATNYHTQREDHDCIRNYFIGPARASGREDIVRLSGLLPRLLVLVISSTDEPVYNEHKEAWRSYMRSFSNLDTYFLEMGETLGVSGDVFTCPGTESYRDIILKTVAAFKWFPIKSYDYVLRTNLSSLWHFPRLLKHIETLPQKGVYAGFQGTRDGVPFASGAGILMSSDVVTRILHHESELLSVNIMDDVDIGTLANRLDIPLLPLPRTDILSSSIPADLSGFHFRVKQVHGNRADEAMIMNTIIATFDDFHYKSKAGSFLSSG
jgi:hypothetical protein